LGKLVLRGVPVRIGYLLVTAAAAFTITALVVGILGGSTSPRPVHPRSHREPGLPLASLPPGYASLLPCYVRDDQGCGSGSLSPQRRLVPVPVPRTPKK
jgi:hypothetical protein